MNVNETYAKTGVCLLVWNGPFIPLSPFLFENVFHLSLRMLDDRSLDRDVTSGDNRGASECVLAGAKLVYLGE